MYAIANATTAAAACEWEDGESRSRGRAEREVRRVQRVRLRQQHTQWLLLSFVALAAVASRFSSPTLANSLGQSSRGSQGRQRASQATTFQLTRLWLLRRATSEAATAAPLASQHIDKCASSRRLVFSLQRKQRVFTKRELDHFFRVVRASRARGRFTFRLATRRLAAQLARDTLLLLLPPPHDRKRRSAD